MRQVSLQDLWKSAQPASIQYPPAHLAGLPEAARRYLDHAIAPGTPLATAVRLRMHGEIKLKSWAPFTAEQVISSQRGMIWAATARMKGLPIRGFDRLLDGEGAMRWKLFGLFPVMTASGRDVTRSAAGRLAAESIWIPSLLCRKEVSWSELDPRHPQARIDQNGETTDLTLAIDKSGAPEEIRLSRWGNPEGTEFHYGDFGGYVEEERTFGGYTIPTRLRIGWYYGTDRFESEGEFFRVTVDQASYR